MILTATFAPAETDQVHKAPEFELPYVTTADDGEAAPRGSMGATCNGDTTLAMGTMPNGCSGTLEGSPFCSGTLDGSPPLRLISTIHSFGAGGGWGSRVHCLKAVY